jgi:hypothetical protein
LLNPLASDVAAEVLGDRRKWRDAMPAVKAWLERLGARA